MLGSIGVWQDLRDIAHFQRGQIVRIRDTNGEARARLQ